MQCYHYRFEIEASLRQVEAEIVQLHQQLGPYTAYHYQNAGRLIKSCAVSFITKLVSGQTQGISTQSSSFTSPIDSAIGSAMGSGFSTKAPSIVAEDDLDNDDISGMFTWDPQQYHQQQVRSKVAHLAVWS